MRKKFFVGLCTILCLSLVCMFYGCGTGNEPEDEKPVSIEITGVQDGAEYELDKDTILPVFNIGTATLTKNDETPVSFQSGTAITEVGRYTLKVVNGDAEKSVTFSVLYPAPVISGITDHSTYYAGIDKVIPTFDRGEAEIVKDDGDPREFISGTELTEVGKYQLIVAYEGRAVSCIFWIKEYKWIPGEGEFVTIDDFSEDLWAHEEIGTKSVQDGKMSLSLSSSESGMIKVYRDINIRTKDYSIVQFEFAEVNTVWDNFFSISISNRSVAGWPTVAARGAEINRVFKNGKWYAYFDLNDAEGDVSALVGLNSLTAHFEIALEGSEKSVVLEDISFVSEIPQGATITGVENNATYTLGTDTVKPVFSEGTATLSRNGGTAEAFTSGTEITVRGNYVLTVVANGIENIVSFTVLDPMAGANGVTMIDNFDADDWTLETAGGMVGSKKLENGKMTFAISAEENGGLKTYRDITLCTKQYRIICFVISDMNAGWDNGFRISIGNRNAAGWPTVSGAGNTMIRVLRDGKWYIYFDLNDAQGDTSALVGLDSVTLHFEINLEGSAKSITLEEIVFVSEIPQGATITGVENNATYTLGTDTVKPVFSEGTATLSRNGGTAEAFTSGTEITVRGNYVLTVVANGIENIVSFTVLDPMAGANGVTMIDNFDADDWTLETAGGMVGSKKLENGKMTFAISAEENGGLKTYRDITLCTKQYRIICFVISDMNAGWDNGFRISIGNRNAAGWPTVSGAGNTMIRVLRDGKWYIYFDLNDAQGDTSALVGLDSVTLHFEINLEGSAKSITLEEIAFVSEIPQENSDVIDSFDTEEWTVGSGSAEPDKVEITYQNGQMTFKALTDQYCEIVSQKTINTVGRKYVRFDMTANGSCWDMNYSISIVDNINWTGNVTANGSNFIKADKPDGTGWYIYMELPAAFLENEALAVTFKMTIAGYPGKYVTLDEICFVDEIPA